MIRFKKKSFCSKLREEWSVVLHTTRGKREIEVNILWYIKRYPKYKEEVDNNCLTASWVRE